MAAIRLTRTHRILIGVVVAGAVVIAGIGFAGSYAAVRTLALHKGFGWFANVFPIGVDAGIVVLLALDLLLTWLRIPFPLLRQTAWLLTGATIAFNGAAAWPDPLGVGMHAIIPVLFVVSVEAARHAIGRVADITADKHMESVRITRWLLAPVPTFRLWRRMKLWELRSYEEVIRREQDRLVYRARLRARYGVAWRRRAPVEAIMPLRLAKYGVPLSETADAGLEAAGIEILAPVRQLGPASANAEANGNAEAVVAAADGTNAATDPNGATDAHGAAASGEGRADAAAGPQLPQRPQPQQGPQGRPGQPIQQGQPGQQGQQGQPGPYAQPPAGYDPALNQELGPDADPQQVYAWQLAQQQMYGQQYSQQYGAQPVHEPWQGSPHDSPWFAAEQQRYAQAQYELQQRQLEEQYAQPPYVQGQGQGQGQQPQFQPQQFQPQQQPVQMVPSGAPGRQRPLGNVGVNGLNAVNGFATTGGSPTGAPNGAANGAPNNLAPAGPAVAPNGQAVKGQTLPAAELPQVPFRLEPEVEQPEAPEAEANPFPNAGLDLPDGIPVAEAYFAAYRRYVHEHGDFPNARQFARFLPIVYNGTAPEERDLIRAIRDLRYRYGSEAETEYIP